MDERFENPSEEETGKEKAGGKSMESLEKEKQDRGRAATTENQSEQSGVDKADTSPSAKDTEETDNEPLNIREDWDSATIYVEPGQSEDIEVTFTRLKKQLQREGITLEKNKHFYRGIFEVAFNEHREETREKIRELAKEDANQ